MKLATYTPRDAQSPSSGIGAVLEGALIDLNYAYARCLRSADGELRAYALADARIPRDMIGFLQGGRRAIDAARRALQFVREWPADARGISGERLRYDLREVRLLAPIPRPGKILGAGRNYLDHAQESLCVFERQCALADIERAALRTEDEEPVESLPVSHLPGKAAGAVADLVRTEDLLVLWSCAGLNPAENVCNARHMVDRHRLSRGVVVYGMASDAHLARECRSGWWRMPGVEPGPRA